MKILFFSPYFHPYISGTTVIPHQVLTHFSKNHKITVLTFRHTSALRPYERPNKNFVIKRMPFWFRVSKGFISPQSLGYFFNQIKTHDVVLMNLPNVEGLALALLAKIYRKPIVGLLNCQVRLGPGLWNKLIETILLRTTRMQCALSDQVISYPEHRQTIPMSREFARKITTVYPPIRRLPISQSFLSKLKRQKSSKIWIGYVGRIAREKGIEYLIRALSKSRLDYTLLFVGPGRNQVAGEQAYFDHIQKLLKERHIPHRFLGVLTDSELGAFYKAIDVLTLPSINNTEVFGMVQAEAMLMSCPIIASNLPGIRVPIAQTGMGILVRPKDPRVLVKSLDAVVQRRNEFVKKENRGMARKLFAPRTPYHIWEQVLSNFA